MIPAAFEYRSPSTLDEALRILGEQGDEAKLLAGGHSLLPLMKLRLAAPSVLIDLGGIAGLNYIREDDGYLAIGCMTRYVDLEDSDVVRRVVPLLAQSAGMIGDMQVRNRGTIGGAVAHADPAGDMPTVVSALRGSIVAAGPTGQRTIDADEFFQDIFTTSLLPDEIVTEIRIPVATGALQNYQKFRRRQIDWAIVGAAVSMTRQDGSISSASVVLTNVGPRPMRATEVEAALSGQPANEQTVHQAAELSDQGLEPSGELGGSTEYKKHIARVITERALSEALGLT
jgi:carbon-monoxide dehydrogenase medium subunit